MRSQNLLALLHCRKAAAGAEMALVAPLLIILMFGSFELGNYFLSEHVVAKAVRDGARFAGRQAFASMPCGGNPTNLAQIQKLVRTGSIAGTTPRLRGWTDDGSVSVVITCDDSGAYSGLYKGMDNVPVVTVSASVPYDSLFNSIGLSTAALQLSAKSEATVAGI